jgi:hypothetical protein
MLQSLRSCPSSRPTLVALQVTGSEAVEPARQRPAALVIEIEQHSNHCLAEETRFKSRLSMS